MIIDSMLQALAAATLAAQNPSVQVVNSQRVENSRDSHPDIGIMITSAISEAVSTQLISSGPAARPA